MKMGREMQYCLASVCFTQRPAEPAGKDNSGLGSKDNSSLGVWEERGKIKTNKEGFLGRHK